MSTHFGSTDTQVWYLSKLSFNVLLSMLLIGEEVIALEVTLRMRFDFWPWLEQLLKIARIIVHTVSIVSLLPRHNHPFAPKINDFLLVKEMLKYL